MWNRLYFKFRLDRFHSSVFIERDISKIADKVVIFFLFSRRSELRADRALVNCCVTVCFFNDRAATLANVPEVLLYLLLQDLTIVILYYGFQTGWLVLQTSPFKVFKVDVGSATSLSALNLVKDVAYVLIRDLVLNRCHNNTNLR